jgi:hypothetical protein
VCHARAQGITADQKPKVFHQDTAGVPGTAEWGDWFGQSLSVGNGDRYADVLIGASGSPVARRPAPSSTAR